MSSVSSTSSGSGYTTQPGSVGRQSRATETTSRPKQQTADASSSQQLTAAEQQLLSKMQASDRAVRAHELAHQSVGAGLTGSINLSYQTGPDGKSYAIGGEVSIDTSAARDPGATIAKMQHVIAAALAPGDPSGQDRAVAAQAQARIAEAQVELSKQQQTQQNTTPKAKTQPSRVQQAYTTSRSQPGDSLSLVA